MAISGSRPIAQPQRFVSSRVRCIAWLGLSASGCGQASQAKLMQHPQYRIENTERGLEKVLVGLPRSECSQGFMRCGAPP